MIDWTSLIGHEKVERWFAAAMRSERLGGSFLIVGTPGIGKRTVASLLARTILCSRSPMADMKPCGVCHDCQQVAAGTHPDLIRVSKPANKSFIPLELLIGPPDARMQEGFCRDIRLRPMQGTRKVAILEDADFLNEEGANCLLKTLEEPPSGAIVILIGTSEQKQLPTIRSRCQILRLGPLTVDDAAKLLRQEHEVTADDDAIAAAMDVSGGDITAAARLLAGDGNELRSAVTGQLSANFPDPIALSRLITKYVDGSGKEPSKRRAAMRDVFAICVQHYRAKMRYEANQDFSDQRTLDRLDRSLRALREVDRSANQSTLIECFAADIAAGITGDRGEIG
jgi:DNA polymerase-3 subunit delta'